VSMPILMTGAGNNGAMSSCMVHMLMGNANRSGVRGMVADRRTASFLAEGTDFRCESGEVLVHLQGS
jgi:hypothetical protein